MAQLDRSGFGLFLVPPMWLVSDMLRTINSGLNQMVDPDCCEWVTEGE